MTDGSHPNRAKRMLPCALIFLERLAERLGVLLILPEGMKGTNFQAAAFAVNEQKAMNTNAECLKIQEPPAHASNARKKKVNGVMFTVVETDGVAAGNLIDGYAYPTGSKSGRKDRPCHHASDRQYRSHALNPGTRSTSRKSALACRI
jgi:hypothetical protein